MPGNVVLYNYSKGKENPKHQKGKKDMNAIVQYLWSRYEKLAYTKNYIFGFMYADFIYYYITSTIIIGLVTDTASTKNGGGKSLRYSPKKEEKQKLIESGIAKILCTKSKFLSEVENSKYNKGEIFEKLIAEKHNQKWQKDNRKFTESGDIIINGIHYQIKFQKATITSEKTLEKLEKEKR